MCGIHSLGRPSVCAAACSPAARATLPPCGSQTAAAAVAARAQTEETPLHEFAMHSTSEAAVAMVIAAYPAALKAKTDVRRRPPARAASPRLASPRAPTPPRLCAFAVW
jgi:hypothetical protein